MTEIQKQSILIVDDERINIKALSAVLADDYDLKVATSAAKAFHIANSETQPDLILLDIVMPDIDGYEACKYLKAEPKTSNIPIIFITGKSDEDDEAMGLTLGASDYITKPFRPAIVLARVKTQLKIKQQADLLEQMSYMDSLTNIHNRRYFDMALTSEWQRCWRNQRPLSLLMMDIDCFKQYNDQYGHQQGDFCLQRVADCLTQALRRASDHLARYGGEEFCVILPETDNANACQLAENVRMGIKALHLCHGSSICMDYVTLSIGVATALPSPEKTPASLILSADELLYQAKKTGRNRVSCQLPAQ